jgi:glycerol uptake facilitator-like aquaporin
MTLPLAAPADRIAICRAAVEVIGTAFLLLAIVGSGIMASRLSPGNAGLELLINSLVTGAALSAFVAALGPVSGAHFNPLVTVALAARGWFPWRDAPLYIVGQFTGALLGVATANAMFGLPLLSLSRHERFGFGLWLGEVVASFGLILLVVICVRTRNALTALIIGAYIAAAYWFTSSTSFANCAVTVGRAFSDTFAGIAPSGVAPFLLAQLIGLGLAIFASRLLIPSLRENA